MNSKEKLNKSDWGEVGCCFNLQLANFNIIKHVNYVTLLHLIRKSQMFYISQIILKYLAF